MKVAIIAVHPDDETLACGGTLLRHKKAGDEIYWIIVTTSPGREKEILTVADMFGFTGVHEMGFPTMRLDEIPLSELISKFSVIFKEIKPEVVYLPFKGDIHTDHQIAFKAAFSCTKVFRFPSIKKILMMETISETDYAPALSENAFLPNCYINITNQMEQKMKILGVFSSELGVHPFSRSIEGVRALATFRGSQSGFIYAESFMILKEMI